MEYIDLAFNARKYKVFSQHARKNIDSHSMQGNI